MRVVAGVLSVALFCCGLFVFAQAQQGQPVGPYPPGLTPAPSNLTINVNGSTGNDICSVSVTCKTIQEGVNIAAQYNYLNTYTATINVADGTFAVNGVAPAVTLPALYNYPQGARPLLNGDTATPANVVISNTLGDAVATANGAYWYIQGFRLKSTSGANHDLLSQNGSNVGMTGAMDFAGNYINMEAAGYSGISAFSQSINMSTTSAAIAFYGFYASGVILDGSTVTFPAGGSAYSGQVLNLVDQSVFGYPTFVNAGAVTGHKFVIANNSYSEYTGTRVSFPGSTAGSLDMFSVYAGDNGVGLYDSSGNLYFDCNITAAAECQINAANSVHIVSAAATYPGLTFQAVGGNDIAFTSVGTAGGLGMTAGYGSIFDFSTGNAPLWWDGSDNLNTWGRLGWGASSGGSYSVPAIDTGISRIGAATLAVGNGAANDTSGIIKAAVHMAGGTTPTGTTGSCSTGTITGGKTAGEFTAPTCAGGTYILSAFPTAPNGYACDAQDQTTPADTVKQTANSTTSVTFTATTALNDVVVFKCMAF